MNGKSNEMSWHPSVSEDLKWTRLTKHVTFSFRRRGGDKKAGGLLQTDLLLERAQVAQSEELCDKERGKRQTKQPTCGKYRCKKKQQLIIV